MFRETFCWRLERLANVTFSVNVIFYEINICQVESLQRKAGEQFTSLVISRLRRPESNWKYIAYETIKLPLLYAAMFMVDC